MARTREFFYRDARRPDGLKSWCKTCHLADGRRYDLAHPQSVREKARRYEHRHRKSRSAKSRRYNAGHLIGRAVIQRNRKARLISAPGTHTAADVQRIRAEQGNRCFWCGESLGVHYHVDHYIPLAKGGSNWPENLDVACPNCNMSKHDLMPGEFVERVAYDAPAWAEP